jgi:hypothetical protein
MIKLVSFCGTHEMWVKEKSITAILKSPQSTNEIFWNVKGSGWSLTVRELPSQLKWMVN